MHCHRSSSFRSCLLGAGLLAAVLDVSVRALAVIENEPRSYFNDLTDSEFASIHPGVQFYPYIPEAWAQAPLPEKPFFGLHSAFYATDDRVKIQAVLLRDLGDPNGRSRTVMQLGDASNPLAVAILRAALGRETDDAVKADFLKALRRCGRQFSMDDLAPYLRPETRDPLRLAAVAGHPIDSRDAVERLLRLATTDASSVIRQAAGRRLTAPGTAARLEDWLVLWRGEDADVAAIAVAPACAAPALPQHRDAVLALCAHPAVQVRAALASSLPGTAGAELTAAGLAQLVGDSEAAVRAEVGLAIDRLPQPKLEVLVRQLTGDPSPEVRRAAAVALGRYATKESFTALVQLTGDGESPLVRTAARNSLLAISASYPVEREIASALTDNNADIRSNACALLAALGSRRYNSQVARLMPREERAENIAHAIQALAAGNCQSAIPVILKRHDHESPRVRAAVAEAVGRLRAKEGYDIIEAYTLNDREEEVRLTAHLAFGRAADQTFEGTLMKVLQRTDYRSMTNPEFLLSSDRAYACWALAQLPSLSPPVRIRLKEHIERAVIATTDGPIYENDWVRTSACWALLTQAKRSGDPAIEKALLAMIAYLKTDPTKGGGTSAAPSTVQLRHYAVQAGLFYTGEALTREPVPLRRLDFDFRAQLPPRPRQ